MNLLQFIRPSGDWRTNVLIPTNYDGYKGLAMRYVQPLQVSKGELLSILTHQSTVYAIGMHRTYMQGDLF